ncbi:MAG: hypothetical protein ACRD2O_12490, partial [Terriglobia bacterium]
IVMYQMLSGNLPFKGETTMQMLFAHIHTPPKPIQEVRADLPGPVARLVMKCLEKNPEMRPPAAQALIQEIEQAEVEIARSRIKQEQLEREQAEKERLARDRSELERQAREKAEAERLAKEKARQEQLARERAEAERRMAERAEAERAARQAQLEELRQEYAEKERRLKEKAEAEQHEREKAQAARLAMMMAQAKHLEEETQTLPAEIQNQAPASHLEAGPTAFRKAAWLVVAAIVCIAIGLGAWYVHRRGQKTSLQQASNTTLASGVVAPPSSPPAAQTSSPAPAGSSGSPSAEGNGTHPTLPPSTANTEPAGSEAPTGAAPVEPQVDQQKIESIIDSGNRYFRQRQYAKAVRQYQAGLKLDPANLALLHLLKEARAAAKLHQPGTTSQTAADTQPSPPSSTPPPVAPSVGSVRIATAPGSQVFIDGSEAGITGADGTLLVPQLSPGKHQVHLTHTGDLGWYGYAFVQPGQTAVSQVTLKASTTVAPPSPKPRASPAVVSFHVVHQHTFGSCSGTLTVGNGRIRYVASKKSHSFDASVASIRQYGTVRYGADFYFQLQDGKQYLFSGPLTALQAFQQARGAVALPAGDGSASLHN